MSLNRKNYLLRILFSFSHFWVKQWLYWLSKLIWLKGKIQTPRKWFKCSHCGTLRILVCLLHSSILTKFVEGTLMTLGIYLYISLFSYLWLAGFHSHDYVPQASVFLYFLRQTTQSIKYAEVETPYINLMIQNSLTKLFMILIAQVSWASTLMMPLVADLPWWNVRTQSLKY